MNNVYSFHYISFRKANNNISKVYDTVLSKVKLKITQFSTLRNIQKLGITNISNLSYLLELDRNTALHNVEKLIEMDFVSYRYDNNNKIKVVSLTNVGKTNLEKQLLFGKKLNTNILKLWYKKL